MTTTLLFYVLFVLWVFAGFRTSDAFSVKNAPNLILVILMLLLAYKVFGPPLHQ